MKQAYRNWTTTAHYARVGDYTEDGEPFLPHDPRVVVVVHDERWIAEIVLEEPVLPDRPHIQSLTIRAPDVSREVLRSVPISYIAEVAAGMLAEIEQDHERGFPLRSALEAAGREPGQVEVAGQAPSLEQYADAWRDTPAARPVAGKRVTRRQALARRFDVSPKTVDDWTRTARDRGLIPPARTGRPRYLENLGQEDL